MQTLPWVTARRSAATFDERAAALLAHFANQRPRGYPKNIRDYTRSGIYNAMAQYAVGQNQQANRLLQQILTENLRSLGHGQSFIVMALMDTYLRYKQRMPPALRLSIRRYITQHPNYVQGATINHKLMFATGGYLAAQEWPDWSQAANVRRVTQTYIKRFIYRLGRDGMVEHDSPIYHIFYLNSLLSLQDHTRDPQLQRQAQIGLELLLLTMAPEWLQGYWASTTARTTQFSNDPYLDGGIGAVGWLYWEGIKPKFWWGASVMHAVSRYRPPDLFRQIAQTRNQPYVHRETQGLTAYRQGYPVRSVFQDYKYTYMDRQFSLFSQAEGQGKRPWTKQMQRMGLTWISPVPGATVVVKQPFQKRIIGETLQGELLQHQGTLLGVYTDDITLITPDNASVIDQMQDSGWLFLHGRSVLIGVRVIKDLQYLGTFEVGFGPRQTRPRASMHHYQSRARHNGVIVQTAPVEQYERGSPRATLQHFANTVKTTTWLDDSGIEDPQPSLKYRSLDGTLLELTFKRSRKINGQAVDYQNWPLHENPWVTSSPGREFLVRQGRNWRQYNLLDWTILDSSSYP